MTNDTTVPRSRNVATDHNHYSTYGYCFCFPSQLLPCLRVNARAPRPGVGVVCVRVRTRCVCLCVPVRVYVCVCACACIRVYVCTARARVVVLRANIMRARRVAAVVRVDISDRSRGRCTTFRTGRERRSPRHNRRR